MTNMFIDSHTRRNTMER